VSILDDLKSVLCDPDGVCCIAGSDGDRAVVDDALRRLSLMEARIAEIKEAEQHLIDTAVLMAQELQEYVDVGIECTGSNAAELATQELLAEWEAAYAAVQAEGGA
jgi:hypothetical protein